VPNNFEKFRDGLTVEQFVKIFKKHVLCYKSENLCPAEGLCQELAYSDDLTCSDVLEKWATASEDGEVQP